MNDLILYWKNWIPFSLGYAIKKQKKRMDYSMEESFLFNTL